MSTLTHPHCPDCGNVMLRWHKYACKNCLDCWRCPLCKLKLSLNELRNQQDAEKARVRDADIHS